MSVGQAVPHDSASLHVTGAARYVDDIPTPANTLHLAFGLSSIAHGVIKSMNLEAVRNAPGVVRVFTADDLPHVNNVSAWPDPEVMLSDGKVEYLGHPIFLVAATSHMAARKAARRAIVDYEELAPILTIDDAIEAASLLEKNPRVYDWGNAREAIKKADRVVEGSIEMGGQEHFYLEGQGGLAIPQDNGDVVIHSGTQYPNHTQQLVADALGKPMNAVRVEVRRAGGGFGGRESQGWIPAVACAVVAQATGLAVKMRYDRDDDIMMTGKRHDFRINYRAGFDDQGRIKGIEFEHFVRCGWSYDLSIPVADHAMLKAENAYLFKDMRIVSHRLKTNTQSATAFRGFGAPQGILGTERVMDHIAHDLGKDPYEIRRVNFFKDVPEDETFDETEPETSPYGMKVRDFVLGAISGDLIASSDYFARRKAVEQWNAANPILKKGIAFTPVRFGIGFTLPEKNQAGALVLVYSDGSIQLNHGGVEMGQGLHRKVAQVAASRFGVDLSFVKITATDTGKVPNAAPTAASSGMDLNGMAVADACDRIRDRMAAFLRETYQTDKIRFEDSKVQIGSEVLSFSEVAMMCYRNRISLSSTGFYKTPKIEWDYEIGKGHPSFYFTHGAAVTEVVVDTLTGEYRVLRTDIIQDVGASLNPALDIGQIEGAFVQGVGWLTTEELIWDKAGRLQTHAPSTYKIPVSSDRPDIFNVTLWDRSNREETIYRSKAVGEPPLLLGISAFLALSDAVSSCGTLYPALNAPATAERVQSAVESVSAS